MLGRTVTQLAEEPAVGRYTGESGKLFREDRALIISPCPDGPRGHRNAGDDINMNPGGPDIQSVLHFRRQRFGNTQLPSEFKKMERIPRFPLIIKGRDTLYVTGFPLFTAAIGSCGGAVRA